MYIYCCKFQNIVPGIEGFAKRIADIKHIEKYIAVKNNKIQAFNQKWLIWDPTALLSYIVKMYKHAILYFKLCMFIAGIKIIKKQNLNVMNYLRHIWK